MSKRTQDTPFRNELLPLDDIEEDPNQPRQTFTSESLEELAGNIEDTADGSDRPWVDGLLHPVVVYPNPELEEGDDGPRYRLLAGARRLRAYRLRGWPAIPAQIREGPSSVARTLLTQLNENADREDVPLWEAALAVRRAWEAWRGERRGAKTKEFAQEFGRSSSWVSQHLYVARARGLARQALEEDLLRHAETYRLFRQLSPEDQRGLVLGARKTRSVISRKSVRSLLEAKEKAAEKAKEKAAQAKAAGKGKGGGDGKGGGGPAGKGKAGDEAKASGGGPTPEVSAGDGGVTVRLSLDHVRRLLGRLGLPVPREDRALPAALLEALTREPAGEREAELKPDDAGTDDAEPPAGSSNDPDRSNPDSPEAQS